MIEAADNPVADLVLSVHRRLLHRAMAEAVGAGVLLTGAMAVASRVLLPQIGRLDGLLAAAMVGVASAMVRYARRRPARLTAAIACDQAAGTPELISTAWSLWACPCKEPDSAWRQAILAHAHHALIRVDVPAILRGRTHAGRLMVGLMLLLSAALWPADTLPSAARQTELLASGHFASREARPDAAGTAAWPAAVVSTSPLPSEIARTGGPEVLTPADAGVKLDPNAQPIRQESAAIASAGQGAGSGLSKGSDPDPIEMPPAGKASPAGAHGNDPTPGDGTSLHAAGQGHAAAGGQIITDAGRTESSVSGDSPAPQGPAIRDIAAVPPPYRAAVREYFNR